MGFAELGLTEKEFFSLPPFRTTIMQLHYFREIERRWEQTRAIMMMVHNVSGNVRSQIRAKQIIDLSFDHKINYVEWTREEAIELIHKWGGSN
jgi:hypothetical protein